MGVGTQFFAPNNSTLLIVNPVWVNTAVIVKCGLYVEVFITFLFNRKPKVLIEVQ